MTTPQSHLLFEFASRQSLSPEAKLVYEAASWWWCAGVPHAPPQGALSTVALNLASFPVNGAEIGSEGDRYTELLTEMIDNRESAWAARGKARSRPRIVFGGKR